MESRNRSHWGPGPQDGAQRTPGVRGAEAALEPVRLGGGAGAPEERIPAPGTNTEGPLHGGLRKFRRRGCGKRGAGAPGRGDSSVGRVDRIQYPGPSGLLPDREWVRGVCLRLGSSLGYRRGGGGPAAPAAPVPDGAAGLRPGGGAGGGGNGAHPPAARRLHRDPLPHGGGLDGAHRLPGEPAFSTVRRRPSTGSSTTGCAGACSTWRWPTSATRGRSPGT